MPSSLPKRVAVIGYGRFGRLWASILKEDFTVHVYDADSEAQAAAQADGLAASLEEALDADVIFYCVPISQFEAIVSEHLARPQQGSRTLVDVLSVKLYPKEVFDRLLPDGYQAMLTHPIFGPDSV